MPIGIVFQVENSMCLYMCTYKYVCVCVCLQLCVRACVRACVCACVHACTVPVCMRMHVHACVHACMHVHDCVCACLPAYMCGHVCTDFLHITYTIAENKKLISAYSLLMGIPYSGKFGEVFNLTVWQSRKKHKKPPFIKPCDPQV